MMDACVVLISHWPYCSLGRFCCTATQQRCCAHIFCLSSLCVVSAACRTAAWCSCCHFRALSLPATCLTLDVWYSTLTIDLRALSCFHHSQAATDAAAAAHTTCRCCLSTVACRTAGLCSCCPSRAPSPPCLCSLLITSSVMLCHVVFCLLLAGRPRGVHAALPGLHHCGHH
jgi:hypothetical protein